jgi:threonine/homoserine/homoserine lactone efflux protein
MWCNLDCVFHGYLDLAPMPAFLGAVGLILLAPGPDMAYMVAAGLAGGRPAATRAALGITSGVTVYVIAVAIGLGTLLSSHTDVLVGLQLIGAAYLAWLAHNAVQESRGRSGPTPDTRARHWFRRGLVVNLTNPKIALFFLAFLPQFLGTARNPALQLLVLGGLLQISGLVADLLVGWAAGTFRERVFNSPGTMRALALASAVVFAALAVLVAAEAVGR